MKDTGRRKLNKGIRILISLILCFAVIVQASVSLSVETKADIATDDLSIRVGYMGMNLDEYVEVAKYHWSELFNLCALDSQAYSYFQRNADGVNYKAILDCANGFYISDILDVSNIYVGDIYNIMFYVRDAQGIWTRFDYYSLFGERYYYPNLPSHRKVIYRTYEAIKKQEVKETVTVYETVPVTESVPVTEIVEITESIPVTEIVPVTDEDGNPVLDGDGNPVTEEVPVLNEDGSVKTEEVPVRNEDGSIKTEERQVYNEDGSPKMEEVPVYNEDGSVKTEEVPAHNEDGSIKTEEVTVYNPDGTPKMETVTVTETDYSKVVGYTFDEAYQFGVEVYPMLAIEDNWRSYNQDFENIYEDFENMTTAHRFRLLFGQTSPTESLTRESANYVSALYITLDGLPTYGDIEEGGEYGSNTVELEVSDLYNQDMTDTLSEYLNVDSTNEDVIVIDKIETISDSLYSDISKVIVYYSVIGNGTASFSVGLGANGERKNYSGQANIVVEDGQASFHYGPIDPEEETPEPDDPDSIVQPDPQDTENDPAQNGMQDGSSDNRRSSEGIESESEILGGDNDPADADSAISEGEGVLADPKAEIMNVEAAEVLNGAYLLSDNIRDLLAGSATLVPEARPNKAVSEVKIEDDTEEKRDMQKMILVLTGAGVILICILGGIYEVLSFRYRLNKRFRYIKAEE